MLPLIAGFTSEFFRWSKRGVVVQPFRLLTQAESLHHKRPLPQNLVRPSKSAWFLQTRFIRYDGVLPAGEE